MGRIGGLSVLVLSVGAAALGCSVKADDSGSDAAGSGGKGGSAGSGGTGGTGGSGSDAVGEILNDPAVKSALEEAADQGVDIVTHTEKDAPDPTGYYFYELGAGTWIASGNGANVGFGTSALEMRVDLRADGSVDTAAASSFDGVAPASFGITRGYLLRGAGTEVTLYGLRGFDCDLSGSSYSISQAYIWTGTLEEGTGDWVNQRQFTVTTATEGELTIDCEEAMVGNTEVVGGWAVAAVPVATQVTADELGLMCVDEGRGYVPTEIWTSAGGSACECTTAFAVSCEG